MHIYFVRHGHPDYANDCLTELGHKQAEAAAKRLMGCGIERIFSSTNGRAVQTAEYTARALGLDVTSYDFMREISWGSVDGEPILAKGHPWLLSDLFASEGRSLTDTDWREKEPFCKSRVVECERSVIEGLDGWLESLGFSRLILERELSLDQIRAIRNAVSCELEFFVHGALCVCYSGQCYLSELIAGRSANRGACIQACRSKYDLVDASGKVLVRDKALLSLKDYNLRGRLRELADAGITSFKIEGRLKNESYVRNVVRDYSMGIDELVRSGDFVRGSFGTVSGGFTPDTFKTFTRGYTEAMNPLAWQPGLATRLELTIFARCPADSSAKP